jgi:photosystem II stability/assembly factor-like uncharacterized protein
MKPLCQLSSMTQRRTDLCVSRRKPESFLRWSESPGLKAWALLLFAVLIVQTFQTRVSAASWTRQTTGTMAWLHGICFLNSNHGWVAGSGGTLLETIDGGANWRKLNPLTKDNLRDVYFADEKIGWLVVERDIFKLTSNDDPRSYLLKTEDGGISWQRILIKGSGFNPRFARAIFSGPDRGWVFGETGLVFATQDGGIHWLRQSPPTKHLLLGGTFVDNAHGWLVGAASTIVQTSDGGLNWQSRSVSEGDVTRFTAASFVGNNLGWAVGTGGRVFATLDGGRTWLPQHSTVDADLADVKFVDHLNGWIVGAQGTVLNTQDGGRHWNATSSGTTHALEHLFFVDQNHGWAVGFGGTVLSYSPATAPKLKS